MNTGSYLKQAGELVKLLVVINPVIVLLFYVGTTYLHSSVPANLSVAALIAGFNIYNGYRIGMFLVKAGNETL